jgi:hypothetical protein
MISVSISPLEQRRRLELNENPNDEIARFLDARFYTPDEAVWRLEEFEMHGSSHSVVRLDLHLENQQRIVHDGSASGMQQSLERNARTQLTDYFRTVTEERKHPLMHTALLKAQGMREISDIYSNSCTYARFPVCS